MKFRRLIAAALAVLFAAPAMAAQTGGCLATTGTYSGLQAANFINAGFSSIFSSNSGTSAPINACGGVSVKGQWWLDTTSGTSQPLKFFDGSQWLTVGTLDITGHTWQFPPFPNQLQASDGSLGAPGISFTADTDTGIYRSASGSFSLVSNGVSVADVTPAGIQVRLGESRGQVRLVKSGSNLVLQPYGGNQLTINSVNNTVPSAGVSLAPTSLTANTTYFIYAYMSGGTMTLEASATGHSQQTATGVEVKTGDATRTLVGIARIITGPAWQDTNAQRFVASWYNRRPRAFNALFSASNSNSSGSYLNFPSSLNCEFVTWADAAVTSSIQASFDLPNSAVMFAAWWVDGAAAAATYGELQVSSLVAGNDYKAVGMSFNRELAEGYHFLGMATAVTGDSIVTIGQQIQSGTVFQ